MDKVEDLFNRYDAEIELRNIKYVCIFYNFLTHCGIVMSYGDKDLEQHWLM